jgi:hypothetical protein
MSDLSLFALNPNVPANEEQPPPDTPVLLRGTNTAATGALGAGKVWPTNLGANGTAVDLGPKITLTSATETNGSGYKQEFEAEVNQPVYKDSGFSAAVFGIANMTFEQWDDGEVKREFSLAAGGEIKQEITDDVTAYAEGSVIEVWDVDGSHTEGLLVGGVKGRLPLGDTTTLNLNAYVEHKLVDGDNPTTLFFKGSLNQELSKGVSAYVGVKIKDLLGGEDPVKVDFNLGMKVNLDEGLTVNPEITTHPEGGFEGKLTVKVDL